MQLSFESVLARDQALARVERAAGKFMAMGIGGIAMLNPGEYTGEDIRLKLSRVGIVPHHHNAWGSLIMQAVKLGLLKNTGRMEQMRVRSSHARMTSVYVKISG